MRRVITILLALALIAVPATAEHKQNPYEEIVRWAGCKAQLVTSDEHSVLDSHYTYLGTEGVLYIGTQAYPGLSDELAQVVLFHEIGHCLQHQSGLLGTLPRLHVELDADRWAADLACARHLDGKRMLHDIFVWAHETFQYDGDPAHGTLAQRIAQGQNAAMCNLPPLQAPVLR